LFSEKLPIEMGRLGRPCPAPFRYIGTEVSMLESYPSYFWVIGRFVLPLAKMTDSMSREVQIDLITSAKHGLEMFIRQQPLRDMLPRSTEKADAFLAIVNGWISIFAGHLPPGSVGDIAVLRRTVEGFAVSFQDELDRIAMFTVTPKGSLDIHRLVAGVSSCYPKEVLEMCDAFITEEIDHAGKCLAFELPTACGFHILRAVETGMKRYVHAATGALPKVNQRNWGEYIRVLNDTSAHPDVIDLLRVLKTKRNPLMHPSDNLEINDAIGLLCLCQAGIETLMADIRRRSMEIKFKESLALLPTL
jgi:hypothetical protein